MSNSDNKIDKLKELNSEEWNSLLQSLVILHDVGIKINIQNYSKYFNDLNNDKKYMENLFNILINNQSIYKVNGEYEINIDNINVKNVISRNLVNVSHIESLIKSCFNEVDDFVREFVEDANKLNDEFNLELFEIYYSQELCRQLFYSNYNLFLKYPLFQKYKIVSMGEHRKKVVNDEDMKEFIQKNNIKFSGTLPSHNYLTDITTIFKTNNDYPLFTWTIEVKLIYQNKNSKFLDILRLVIYLNFFKSVKFSTYIAFNKERKSVVANNIEPIPLSQFKNKIDYIKNQLETLNIINFYKDISNINKDKKFDGIIYNSYENIMSLLDKISYILDSIEDISNNINDYENIFPLTNRLINLDEYSKPIYNDLLIKINKKFDKEFADYLIENPTYDGNLDLIKNLIKEIKISVNTPILNFLNSLDPYKIRYVILYCYLYKKEALQKKELVELIYCEHYNESKIYNDVHNTKDECFNHIEIEILDIENKLNNYTENNKYQLFIAILFEIDIYFKKLNNNMDYSKETKNLNKFKLCNKSIANLIINCIEIYLLIYSKNIFLDSQENNKISYDFNNIQRNIETIENILYNKCNFSRNFRILKFNFINNDSHNDLLLYMNKNFNLDLKNLLQFDFTKFMIKDEYFIEACKLLQDINKNFYILYQNKTNSQQTETAKKFLLSVIGFLRDNIDHVIENEFLKELKS